jgi:protoheme IX farnesyltransferase
MIEGVQPQGARLRQGRATRRSFADSIATVRDYFALTKPRIITLLLLTTVTTMFVAEPSGPPLSVILWTILGGFMAAGGAGAVNHYLDRERDARMERTSSRPIVSGRIPASHGLAFGIILGLLAFLQLWVTVNPLAAVLAMVGFLGYVLLYTVWLKPLTPQNIVIGGSAGAVPPLVGWAAATGSLSWEALWPFAIIFFWTPPHFWALSLMIKEDYEKTGVPMLPVVKGDFVTRRQIVIYSVMLFVVSLGPVVTGLLGPIYLVAAVSLGLAFTGLSVALLRRPNPALNLRTYLFSLVYLALLFVAMAVDAVA